MCESNVKCMYMMFVQAGLDRPVSFRVGEVNAEFIKKQMKEKSSYCTCSPHQVWKFDSKSQCLYQTLQFTFIYHKSVALHLCFCQRHILTPSCLEMPQYYVL